MHTARWLALTLALVAVALVATPPAMADDAALGRAFDRSAGRVDLALANMNRRIEKLPKPRNRAQAGRFLRTIMRIAANTGGVYASAGRKLERQRPSSKLGRRAKRALISWARLGTRGMRLLRAGARYALAGRQAATRRALRRGPRVLGRSDRARARGERLLERALTGSKPPPPPPPPPPTAPPLICIIPLLCPE